MSHFKGKVDVAPSVLYHLKMDGNKQTTILPPTPHRQQSPSGELNVEPQQYTHTENRPAILADVLYSHGLAILQKPCINLTNRGLNMADIAAIDFPERALREREVEQIVGLKKSRIRELEAAGEFPKRRVFGARSVRWLQSEILEYIQSRPKATA